jgi:hypothetical protein
MMHARCREVVLRYLPALASILAFWFTRIGAAEDTPFSLSSGSWQDYYALRALPQRKRMIRRGAPAYSLSINKVITQVPAWLLSTAVRHLPWTRGYI